MAKERQRRAGLWAERVRRAEAGAGTRDFAYIIFISGDEK